MSTTGEQPFKRDVFLDKPGIVGARWWQEGLVQSNPVARRAALKGLLILGTIGAGIAMIASVETCASSSSDDEFRTETRAALDMQKEYGWNFGATTETLTFDGKSTLPFDRAALAKMADDFAPTAARLRRYYVPTLFQSPTALPKSVPQGDPGTVAPLKDVLSPIFTPAMDSAYRCGKALASLFEGPRGADVAVVVDLAGPESVAFAAGAAGKFDPVFTFDNWPHPRGVVAAHQTLAAAAYFQPLFARHVTGAPPMFVLDRQRLAPYTDEKTQFDNRHLAKLPSADDLRALGVKHVLYVVPSTSDTLELDDLNDAFVNTERSGISVRMVATAMFRADADAYWLAMRDAGAHGDAGAHADARDAGSKLDGGALAAPSMPGGVPPLEGPPWYYGGTADSHDWFWTDYPWAASAPPAHAPKHAPTTPNPGKSYTPRTRTTAFSGVASGTRPASFGVVPVVIAVGTGVILGSLISRNGSWNRSSGGWGG